MKLKIELEVEVSDDMFDEYDGEQKEWFDNEVMAIEQLYLHSNEICDSVGTILNVKIIEFKN